MIFPGNSYCHARGRGSRKRSKEPSNVRHRTYFNQAELSLFHQADRAAANTCLSCISMEQINGITGCCQNSSSALLTALNHYYRMGQREANQFCNPVRIPPYILKRNTPWSSEFDKRSSAERELTSWHHLFPSLSATSILLTILSFNVSAWSFISEMGWFAPRKKCLTPSQAKSAWPQAQQCLSSCSLRPLFKVVQANLSPGRRKQWLQRNMKFSFQREQKLGFSFWLWALLPSYSGRRPALQAQIKPCKSIIICVTLWSHFIAQEYWVKISEAFYNHATAWDQIPAWEDT